MHLSTLLPPILFCAVVATACAFVTDIPLWALVLGAWLAAAPLTLLWAAIRGMPATRHSDDASVGGHRGAKPAR